MERSMKAHDIFATLAQAEQMDFRKLSDFNAGHIGVFWCMPGTSPWERHPDTDEILYVLEGEVDITVLTDDGPITTKVSSGSLFVVPKGLWHRHEVRTKLKELYVTPGASEMSTAADPRA